MYIRLSADRHRTESVPQKKRVKSKGHTAKVDILLTSRYSVDLGKKTLTDKNGKKWTTYDKIFDERRITTFRPNGLTGKVDKIVTPDYQERTVKHPFVSKSFYSFVRNEDGSFSHINNGVLTNSSKVRIVSKHVHTLKGYTDVSLNSTVSELLSAALYLKGIRKTGKFILNVKLACVNEKGEPFAVLIGTSRKYEHPVTGELIDTKPINIHEVIVDKVVTTEVFDIRTRCPKIVPIGFLFNPKTMEKYKNLNKDIQKYIRMNLAVVNHELFSD